MNYELFTDAKAVDQLALIWATALDQAAVTKASNAIDRRLAMFGPTQGESRAKGVRILCVLPLVCEFTVNVRLKTVVVRDIRFVDSNSSTN